MGWDISLSDNEGVGFDEVRDRYEEDGETNEGPEKETDTEPKAETAELTRGEIREKLREKDFLPTREQVKKAFSNDIDFLTFCKGRDTFDGDVEYSPIFEIWNKEYMKEISNYMSKRLDELGATPEGPVRVVEVGAGDGRLSHFLNKYMGDDSGRVEIITTDSGEWTEIDQLQDVKQYSAKEAVQEFEPEIVISSWMPRSIDFTKDFRAQESVQEYLLIGEPWTGITGKRWETWGNSYGIPEETLQAFEGKVALEKEIPAPFEQDGFSKEDLKDLSDLQMCRTDYPSSEQWDHSRTISFKRTQVNE